MCVYTHVRTQRHILQHFATHSATRIATHCNTQCNAMPHTATSATHYNTLQHTAKHCNTLPNDSTHCKTPKSFQPAAHLTVMCCRSVLQ